MSFCFTVCIFLGAVEAGLVIHLDRQSIELAENDPAIKECIKAWADFFRNPYTAYKKRVSGNISDEKYELAHFEHQKQVWKTHTSVIYTTIGHDVHNVKSPKVAELAMLLPQPERNFGLGWCSMVELLAAVCFSPISQHGCMMEVATSPFMW
jgi:hypothetical protein